MVLLAWSALPLEMKVIWVAAVAASVVFVIQTVMTFTGEDADLGLDTVDGGRNFYIFRNLVNFVMGFGWSAIILSDLLRPMWNVLFSFFFGLLFVVLMMGVFHSLSQMQKSRKSSSKADVVGYKGKVDLPIPSANQGKGKVRVSINGTVREYDAITRGEEELATGTSVIVLNVVGENILEVKRIRLLSDCES
ncbi:MAG: hypothetical protein J6X69_04505 [Bacteroidales bacterium]|nr:hypothetical protein [Bacteroidales bacterium]